MFVSRLPDSVVVVEIAMAGWVDRAVSRGVSNSGMLVFSPVVSARGAYRLLPGTGTGCGKITVQIRASYVCQMQKSSSYKQQILQKH